MTILSISNQTIARNQIAPKLLALKDELDKRLPIWDKLPLDKKIKWVKSGKDPVMGIAHDVYAYLRNNFFGEVR